MSDWYPQPSTFLHLDWYTGIDFPAIDDYINEVFHVENTYKPITSNELRSKMSKIWSDLFILMDRRAIQNVK